MSRPSHQADRVFRGGRLLTLDSKGSRAEALAVSGERIAAVGSDRDIGRWIGPGTDVVELDGRVVTPGFIETHAHIYWYGMTLDQVDLQPWVTGSIAAVQEALRAAAGSVPAGSWIQGYGFDPNLIAERRQLTRTDIDAVVPDHPVFVTVGHLAWTNSRALELAGIDRETPDPEGGRFERDEAGEPNGVLHEIAAVARVMVNATPLDACGAEAAVRRGAAAYARQGITTVHDPLTGAFAHHQEAFAAVAGDQQFPLRLVAFPASFARHQAPTSDRDTTRLRRGPVKLFADGSIQYYTGALKAPYYSRPEDRVFRCCGGFRTIEPEQLAQQVREIHAEGSQIAIHANGDDAIQAALDALEAALDAEPRSDHRHRIEHCQMISDDQLDRMARLGIGASIFVNHVRYYGDLHRRETIGPERAARISPLRSALDRGVPFGLHSDSPVTPVSPLASMGVAVNRRTASGFVLGEAQRIAPEEALRAYTSMAAHLCHEDTEKGSLEPGKFADLAILSDDPLSIAPEKIEEIQVCGTVLGGQPVKL